MPAMNSQPSKREPAFHVHQGADGQWYWHLKAANGRVIAQGEGHKREADAWRAVRTVKATAAGATIRD